MKNERVRVSVCIPVYKAESHFERCVRSLFEQSLEEGIEFVFVDDCSPDKSVGILERLLLEYPSRRHQVVLLRHEKNRGRVAARRNALSRAKGEYVIYCDADDRVDTDLYEKMLAVADSERCDVVVAPIKMIWPDGREQVLDASSLNLDELVDEHFGDTYLNSMCTKLMRREICMRVDSEPFDDLVHGEDMLLTTKRLLLCSSVGFVHGSHYNYHREADSGTVSNKDCRLHVENLMTVGKLLKGSLGVRHAKALMYLQHVVLMTMIRSTSFTADEFRSYSPTALTANALCQDERLQIYKKALLRICSANYAVGMLLVRLLLRVEKFFRRKVS